MTFNVLGISLLLFLYITLTPLMVEFSYLSFFYPIFLNKYDPYLLNVPVITLLLVIFLITLVPPVFSIYISAPEDDSPLQRSARCIFLTLSLETIENHSFSGRISLWLVLHEKYLPFHPSFNISYGHKRMLFKQIMDRVFVSPMCLTTFFVFFIFLMKIGGSELQKLPCLDPCVRAI